MISYGIVFIILAVIIAAAIIMFLGYDYFFHQKKFFNGREYRRKYGKFSFASYVENTNPIKGPDWLKQKNKGIKPKLYKWKKRRKNYLVDIECIVPKKGL